VDGVVCIVAYVGSGLAHSERDADKSCTHGNMCSVFCPVADEGTHIFDPHIVIFGWVFWIVQ